MRRPGRHAQLIDCKPTYSPRAVCSLVVLEMQCVLPHWWHLRTAAVDGRPISRGIPAAARRQKSSACPAASRRDIASLAAAIVASMSASRVGGRNEQRLVLAARHVDAAVDQAPEVAGEARRVRSGWRRPNRSPARELKNSVIMLPTRATECGMPAAGRPPRQPGGQPGAELFQPRVGRLVAEHA